MKKMIDKVLLHPTVRSQPPVLVDIGASGSLPEKWNLIAPHSIGIAFDADTRDFKVSEAVDKGYRKLYSLNRLVAEESSEEVDFYLTRSPHCSSSLHPDNKAVKDWAMSPLFDVEKSVKMAAVDVHTAILSCGVDYIDWYKSDSQGTDLRIFKGLPQDIATKAIVTEFEPGVIDAYVGEDKLHDLMAFMDQKPFWVSNMTIKGSQRIDQTALATLNALQRRHLNSFLKTAPGWCEISYINRFENDDMGQREHLLGWVFSSIMGEHAFAHRLAMVGGARFGDLLFEELITVSRRALSNSYGTFALAALKRVARLMIRR